MRFPSPHSLARALRLLVALLVLKVTASVVLRYGSYFPPDFASDFLQGRESYFSGSYQWAFYPHIAAGPLSLVLGMLLVSDRFRLRFSGWHRVLGRVQVFIVLALVAPSGLWMACRADAGPVAGLGFAALAVVTATSAALGWRTAVQRRFAAHRRWMWRCYLALCSTVVLRLIAGFATVTGIEVRGLDVFAAWGSWLLPLAVFELARLARPKIRRWFALDGQNSPTVSPPAIEISARRIVGETCCDR